MLMLMTVDEPLVRLAVRQDLPRSCTRIRESTCAVVGEEKTGDRWRRDWKGGESWRRREVDAASGSRRRAATMAR